MGKIKIAPSILAANAAYLGDDTVKAEKAGADYLHIDIMDGHFVPNLSFSADTVKALRGLSKLVFDVHLMISEPYKYIESFAKAGADIITVHAEAVDDIAEAAEKIHALGVKAGISVKPGTPAEVLEKYIDMFDLILVMTVEPGFGGQKYIEDMNEKIKTVRRMIEKTGKCIDLEVDGGITAANIGMPTEAGADVIVAGSAIFKSDNIEKTISEMRLAAK